MKILYKITSRSILTIAFFYVGLLVYPSFLFSNKIDYNHCQVYSDSLIDNKIGLIIDEATERLSKSDLYDRNINFKIFICNKRWRFRLLNQGKYNATGVTDMHLTRHVFIRKCDIPNNKIVPRPGQRFGIADRPLTYYFAHEMTHVLEANYKGRLDFRTPTWLIEGYADYVGKAGNFDFNENLRLLHLNAPELDPKLGLYRYYHLFVAYLLDKKGLKIKQILEQIPNLDSLKPEIMNLPYQ